MTTPRQIVVLLFALFALGALGTVAAQDDASLLTLTSPDPAHPVQFQAIAPGDCVLIPVIP
jgi:hypothetical protein